MTTSTETMLISSCNVKGCCLVDARLSEATSLMSTEAITLNNKSLIIPSITSSVIHEVCHTAYQLPKSLIRLAADVWSHVKKEPKKPTWDIQTTVVMGFLQAFRDQSLSKSLEFWRLMLIVPTFIAPITSKIEEDFIVVKKRNLCGILKLLDQHEDGTRKLDAEWMSAITTWEKICGGHRSVHQPNHNRDNTAPLMLEAPPSCEKIVFYIHGGAYCAMSAQTHRNLTHKISKATKRRVLAVNYRLAPETRFPGALYDVVQTFLYLIDPNEKYRLDPKNIIFMGDSAGGGLCLATMLYLRDHSLPLPEGAALLSPWVDLTFSYPSWKDASLFDYLPSNPGELTVMNPALYYLDSQELASHPYVSPVFADNFGDLPPILIQSGGCESLRDEICDLTRKIQMSKSTIAHHEIYEDMVHVFQAFPFSRSSEAIESIGWWAKVGISLINQWQAIQADNKLLPSSQPITEEVIEQQYCSQKYQNKKTERSSSFSSTCKNDVSTLTNQIGESSLLVL